VDPAIQNAINAAQAAANTATSTGNTAWMLASTALVLFMFPGLALFYGGMVRAKSVLNMMMMSFGALFLVGTLWVIYGYSLAFTASNGFIGSFTEAFLLKDQIASTSTDYGLPTTVFVTFQLMFAGLTVALISGAIADRVKFGSWMIFVFFWATLVYFPVAHWVFDFTTYNADGSVLSQGGWIANNLKAIDYAGGTAVHINAGVAGLAVCLVVGKRIGFGKSPFRPHNLPLVMLGSGILWFGWYGFNSGSALAAGNGASVVMINTTVATCTAAIGWLIVEKLRDGHATSLGASSGIVTGLVAITPACGAVSPGGAILLGLFAGVVCAYAVGLKYKLGFDDSLDVVGVHLIGGIIGTLAIGFIATSAAPNGVNGLFYGGGFDQLWRQAVAAGAVLAYSGIIAFIIAFIIHKTIGMRISEDDEQAGVDITYHGETAYELNESGLGGAFVGASIGHGSYRKADGVRA
jgi:Amt family ammonium transporter